MDWNTEEVEGGETAETVPRIPAPWSQQRSPANSGAGGGAADTTSTSLLHRKQVSGTGGAETVPSTVVTPTTLCSPALAYCSSYCKPDNPRHGGGVPDPGSPSSSPPLIMVAMLATQTTSDKTKVLAVPVPLVVTPATPVLLAAARH